MLFEEFTEGLRNPADNPCWKGYYPVGTKKKSGRTVPNCVPRNEGVDDSTLSVGDPVIITGNVEYRGKTGDVREIGRDGAFVVVDLYNYGPYSFHSSDVSYNDYADSEDELNEFALDDDGDDPTEDYPCYDCGSTIFLHHTKLCDFAEPNAKRDLPAEPGTQYWTGQVPKGLAPIPGLAESMTEGDDRGDYHATARAANQASRTAKSKQQHAKAADLHSLAATYALSAGQDQSVINDHQMSAQEHDRASRGLKESDMTEGAGTHQDLARMEARLKAARSGQVKMSFDAMRRLSSQIIKLKFDLGLLESANESQDVESIRDRIAALQQDLKAVTGSYPGDDRNRSLIRSEIFRAKEELKAARSKKPGVTETSVAKYADMGATNSTTHFIKNVTTGKIVSPHRSLQDAQDALVGNERDSNDKFKIVRAKKSSVGEGSNAKTIKPVTPAAKRYHEKHKWLLNGNIPGAAKEHYDMIQKLNQKSVSEGSTDDDEAPYHTRILDPQTLEVIADDGPYDWENDAVDRAEAYLSQARRQGQNIVAQVYQPAYGKNYVTWQVPDQGDYNLEEQGVAEQEKVGNMPADKFDDAMARLKQLAGAGPLKTVWDPQKRVYKNVPTAVQPTKDSK